MVGKIYGVANAGAVTLKAMPTLHIGSIINLAAVMLVAL
jgi:hypothetical protein